MAAMLTTSDDRCDLSALPPPVGSARVSPLSTGIITSRGRDRTRVEKSALAEKYLPWDSLLSQELAVRMASMSPHPKGCMGISATRV